MKAIRIKIVLLFMTALLLASGCNKKSVHAGHDEYTCPMHPTVLQDKPGVCPICGMDLVKKGQPGQEVKITAELNYLLKPTNAMVISSIRTIVPVEKALEVNVKANGIITYDTRRSTLIPIRFGGRIEKLFIKYNFQPVRKGQKILEIYSPELLTAQRDLLYLIRADAENKVLIDGAKQKLQLLGINPSQIDQIISTGKESYSFAVYSPVDGYIIEDAVSSTVQVNSQASGASPMDGGMGSGNSSGANQRSASQTKSELLTREGMYVSAGQTIFKVVNTDEVWAEFDVYQRDAGSIKVNDSVKLMFDNSKEKNAKVNFVKPFFQSGENFVQVRTYLSNPGNKLTIGQLVRASFTTPSGRTLWIPLSARLDLGSTEIVFAKRRGVFRPKSIVTAQQSGDWIEILSGLVASDSVAYNAQFMVDSESFIKVRN